MGQTRFDWYKVKYAMLSKAHLATAASFGHLSSSLTVFNAFSSSVWSSGMLDAEVDDRGGAIEQRVRGDGLKWELSCHECSRQQTPSH